MPRSCGGAGLLWASVGRLLLHGGPSAIAWGISHVVVDALKRQAGRTFSHISAEILKRICPPITHANATGEIVFGLFPIRTAAHFHAFPCGINSAMHSAMSYTDSARALTHFLKCAWAAHFASSARQIGIPNNPDRPAIAPHYRTMAKGVTIYSAYRFCLRDNDDFSASKPDRQRGVWATFFHAQQYHATAWV